MKDDYDDEYSFPLGKIVLGIFLFFVVMLIGGWIVQGNNFFMYKFFAPKQEEARRQVYEQTHSYKSGSIQRLNTLCTQIADADEHGKSMLYQVVNQEFADWDIEDVPDYLRSCLSTARAKSGKNATKGVQ